jgi:CelD/BcsL family acetyltransferase involved in cellulose biosynthesis
VVRHNQPVRVVEVPNIDRHAAEWDELVAAMNLPSPFLRSWWLGAVDEGEGAYVLVLDGDRLVGGLPLAKRALPGLTVYRFVGHGRLCPDHLDVVAAPERLAAVSEELAAWARRRGNRLFDLAGVAEGSRIASWLPHATTSPREAAPCGDLPDDYEDYLAGRSKSFRKTWRRTRNRFDRLEASVRIAEPADVAAALADFERLHRERGDRTELLAELPRLTAAMTGGVAAGEVWLEVLATKDRTLGVALSFATCGRLSLYQNARTTDRDADNAGTALGLAAVRQAIENGFTEIDLLRGEETYKFEWGGRVRGMSRVRAGRADRDRRREPSQANCAADQPRGSGLAGRIRLFTAEFTRMIATFTASDRGCAP